MGRLWLVASAGLAVWFVVVWPLQVLKDTEDGRYSYERCEKDFANGQCRPYQTAPLGTLQEPAYGQPCYHIYLSRKYDSTVPYTPEARNSSNSAQDRVSGLVYFFGWLFGWILAGFRPQH